MYSSTIKDEIAVKRGMYTLYLYTVDNMSAQNLAKPHLGNVRYLGFSNELHFTVQHDNMMT